MAVDRRQTTEALNSRACCDDRQRGFWRQVALLKQLENIRENAEDALAVGDTIAKAYAVGKVELPERAHTSHLLWQFLWSQHNGDSRAEAKWAIQRG